MKRRAERHLAHIKAERARRRAGRPGSPESQRGSCHRHRPFPTYEEALEHYRAQVHEGRTDPGQVIYRCDGCSAWHHGGSAVRSLGRALEEGAG